MTLLADVLNQMQALGLPAIAPQHIRFDGGVTRWGPKRRAWCTLKRVMGKDGQEYVYGAYGSWGRVETVSVPLQFGDSAYDSAAELARLRAKAQQQEEAARERRVREIARAQDRGLAQWRAALREPPAGGCAYLVRKGVADAAAGEGLRFTAEGGLLMPLLRYDRPREQSLMGVQLILPDGTKRFTKGLDKPGACFRLGPVAEPEVLLVCEGLATGLSIRAATDKRFAVYVALDAGNLQPVGDVLRELFPKAYVLFCADDDHATAVKVGGVEQPNPGRYYAMQAARRVGRADVVSPYFARRPAGEAGAKLTDFNDLHLLEGLQAVRTQFAMALRLAEERGRVQVGSLKPLKAA